MSFRMKIGIIVGSIVFVSLFLPFLIFNSAQTTNHVVEKQEQESKPLSLKENGEMKKTILHEKEGNKPFTIVIDPGHQQHANLDQEAIGPKSNETKSKVSSGTMGVISNKPEYQLTLEAAVILKELLEERDFNVVLTREVNEVDISNKERAEIANQHGADLMIRLHADGSEDQAVNGFHILTPAEGHPMFEKSLQASQTILNTVQSDGGINTNNVSFRSDLTGFNWSEVPTTLIEMGFMTNPEEDQKLSDQAYLRKLMTYIAEGIVAYRGSGASLTPLTGYTCRFLPYFFKNKD